MSIKKFALLSGIVVICLLGAVACSPQVASGEGLNAESSAQESAQEQAVNNGEEMALESLPLEGEQGQDIATGEIVDATPMSEEEINAEGIGKSDAGAAGGSDASEPNDELNQGISGPRIAFTEEVYEFGLSHPADFVVRELSADEFSYLSPTPDAVFSFMNPKSAASDVEELADLEVRIFETGEIESLESWLTKVDILLPDSGDQLQSFSNEQVSGFQFCSSTLMMPNCFYFFVGNDRVYELVPGSQEGEMMLNTFTLDIK